MKRPQDDPAHHESIQAAEETCGKVGDTATQKVSGSVSSAASYELVKEEEWIK